MSGRPGRLLVAAGGLCGLAGVAASAAAAHVTGSSSLQTAAQFLLFPAPVLLVLPALASAGLAGRRTGLAAGYALLLGLVLFSGDLALRALAQRPLFPTAAPAGGILLMAGWALVAVSALMRSSRRCVDRACSAPGTAVPARPSRSAA